VSGFCWFLTPPLPVYILIHMGMIWLVRSLYHYQSVIAATADMGLNALSLLAAIWAFESAGSLFLSLWCYFLLQDLFVVIPANLKRVTSSPLTSMAQSTQDETFQRAYRSAEAALRRIYHINLIALTLFAFTAAAVTFYPVSDPVKINTLPILQSSLNQ
jgi:hypothetical protein